MASYTGVLRFWLRMAALCAACAIAPARAQSVATDSVRLHARLSLQISEFHAAWQRYWRKSETARAEYDKFKALLRARLPYMHCHADVPSGRGRGSSIIRVGFDVSMRPFSEYPLIRSDSSEFSTCPTWMMSQAVPLALDESVMLDGALLPDYRDAAQRLRASMIRALDSAATQLPADGWIAGQRVRLYIDQRDSSGAQRTVDACLTDSWWCAALRGHVAAWRGRTLLADSLFHVMQQGMPTAQRCEWENDRDLLPRSEREEYTRQTCTARLAMSATMWWLADPLYRTAGNERYVTQEVRRVNVALRRAVDSDERYVWDVARGGDAMSRLVERYGWPTYVSWGGLPTDVSHSGYLHIGHSAEVPPYTTFEYTNDREHFVPDVHARRNPFAAVESDWSLVGEPMEADSAVIPWPVEHMRVTRPIAQLRDGQFVMLRRQSQIVAVAAITTKTVVQVPPGPRADALSFDAMLVRTTGPTQVDSLAQRIVRAGSTIVLQGTMASMPALVAVEAQGVGPLRIDARTRFGITPPPPLSAMSAADVAISDVALVDVGTGRFDENTPADTLLDHLHGSVRFDSTTRRIGVYWETYGIAVGDTVAIALRVARDDDASLARKLGVALNVASDPNRPLEIRWNEPDPQHATRTLVGPVPVQQRFLVLNLGQLAAGPYALEISITRRGSPTIHTRRTMVLEP